ncbi:hypothetical protein Syun_007080 [Stephania yunnanensis]|uniref:Uncharacterized protein n=1 Tax=Stephania yunnanensis TaxID=152371 RepID=A0AAP0L1B6_9MAGN
MAIDMLGIDVLESGARTSLAVMGMALVLPFPFLFTSGVSNGGPLLGQWRWWRLPSSGSSDGDAIVYLWLRCGGVASR